MVVLFLANERICVEILICLDYERVISHHIQQENYRSALEVLAKQVMTSRTEGNDF